MLNIVEAVYRYYIMDQQLPTNKNSLAFKGLKSKLSMLLAK